MTNETTGTEAKKNALATKLAKNAPYLAGLLVLILVVLAGAWGYHFYQEQNELKAQAALFTYENQMQKLEQEMYDAKLKEQEKGKEAALPVIEKTPESFSKNFSVSATELEKLIIQHKGTRAATVSAIGLADMYSEYGMDAEARRLIDQVKSSTSNAVLQALLALQKISIEGDASQCEAVQGDIAAITAKQELKFLWPEAYLRQAACALSMNKPEQAKSALQKIKADFSDSSASKKAEVLERLLALKNREGA